MKHIYLDTSHLLKWENKTLRKNEIEILNAVAADSNCKFVISDIHIVEISNKSDRKQLAEDYNFICQLPFKVLLTVFDIYKNEVICAYKKFNSNGEKIVPPLVFEEKDLCHDDIEKVLLSYDEQQKHHNELDQLIKIKSSEISSISKRANKDVLKNIIRDSFKLRLKLVAEQSSLEIAEEGAFIDYVCGDPHLCPSLKINFYMHMTLIKNNKTKIISVNDWFDVLHANAAPYVDYFSLDRESCDRLKNVVRSHNIHIAARIHSDLAQLFSGDSSTTIINSNLLPAVSELF